MGERLTLTNVVGCVGSWLEPESPNVFTLPEIEQGPPPDGTILGFLVNE